ncbi:MAG: FG-GAP-like repeat-containing protein [Polyangiaceae bacterium]
MKRKQYDHRAESPPRDRLRRFLFPASLWMALAVSGCVVEGGESESAEDVGEGEQAVSVINLAQGKSATQSSDYNAATIASVAVDGNTNGGLGNGSVTHTGGEASPWWRVDLGVTSSVGTIEIYNRTDCCFDRLSNFKLSVSNDGAEWQSWDYPGTPASASTVLSFPVNRPARYVKVQLNNNGTTRYLSLAEVKVLSGATTFPGSASPTTLSVLPSAPVGTTDGKFAVDAQGNATYSIPIQVPPGIKGVEPRLALEYRSSGSNGPVGMGWALSGLSAITRCPRTMATDGARGAVNGDSNDRFCLDGQRLVAVSGNYGQSGTEYRTEVESFARVYSYGTCGTGPCNFLVNDKSGNTVMFGSTIESRPLLADNATARAWYQDKLSSPNINYYTVAYTAPVLGQIYPSEIKYTFNDTAPTLRKRKVTFTYEDRVDPEIAYLAGTKISTSKRLKSIKTYVESQAGDQLVRDYRLDYTQSPATRRSLVTAVTECDGKSVCLPSTKLSYNSAAGFSGQGDQAFDVVNPPGYQYQEMLKGDPGAILHPGDFNGDGKTDFLRQEQNSWSTDQVNTAQIYLSNGDGTFAVVTPATILHSVWGDLLQNGLRYSPGGQVDLGDWNGDGKLDMLRRTRGDWATGIGENPHQLLMGDGAGNFTWATSPEDGMNDIDVKMGAVLFSTDLDGDGRTDLLRQPGGAYASSGQAPLIAYRSLGGGSTSNPFKSVPFSQDNGDGYFLTRWSMREHSTLFPIDVNGDGMADIVRQEYGVWGADGVNTFQVFLAKGDGVYTLVEPHLTKWSQDVFQQMLNGEGARIIPGDFNGDGKMDFLRDEFGPFATDSSLTFQVYFSMGNGNFDVVMPIGTAVGANMPSGDLYQDNLRGDNIDILPMDYNGDGKTDFLRLEKGDWDNDYWFSCALYISRGDGYFDVEFPGVQGDSSDYCTSWLRGDIANVIPGDYNGDGKTDLIRQEHGWADDDALDTFQVYFSKGDRAPDTLKKVENGLRATVDVTYAPITDATIYTPGTGTPADQVDVRSPMYVVQKYQTSNGADLVKLEYSFTYEGARTDRNGRGFLGFARVVQTNKSLGSITTMDYAQTFPLIGSLQSRNVENQFRTAGVLTTWTYDTGPIGFPRYVKTTQEDVVRSDAAGSIHTRKRYELDDLGNVVILHDDGLIDDASDDVDTCTEYRKDGSAGWKMDFPSRTIVGSACTLGANSACSCTGILERTDRSYDSPYMNVTDVYSYHAANQIPIHVAFTYDALGDVVTRTSPGLSPSYIYLVETNTYDPEYGGYLISQTTANGGLQQTVQLTYDPRSGVVIARTDAAGATTTSQVDGFGRVVARSALSPSGYLVPTEVVVHGDDYDASTNPIGGPYRETRKRNSWTSDDFRWEREYLEENGRVRRTLSQSSDAQSAVQTAPVAVDRLFDASGEVIRETLPYFVGATPVQLTFFRDWQGRLVKTKDPSGIYTNIMYSNEALFATTGRLKVTTMEGWGTANQRVWYRWEDPQGATVRQQDAEGRITNFAYDGLGRRTQISDAAGTTTTAYDWLGRVTSVTSPDRGTVTSTYNTSGWLAQTTDARGVTTTYTYDALGRVTKKEGGGDTVEMTYDDATKTYATGRLTRATVRPTSSATLTSAEEFSYTASGAVAVQTFQIGADAYTIESSYDPQGRLRTLTYPGGDVQTRTYNPQGLLSTIAIGNTVYASYTGYNASGQPGALTNANGVVTTYTYDASRRLASNTTVSTALSGSPALMNQTYGWDSLHQITGISDALTPARSQTFTYSNAGQLVQATGIYGTLSYQYDSTGSLTMKEGVSYTIEPGKHQVKSGTSGGATVFSANYDASGNRLSMTRDGHSYGYSFGAENRLKQITQDGAVIESYDYDFAGERLKKVEGTRVTHYVTPAYEVALVGTKRILTKYVLGPSGRLAAVSTEMPIAGVPMFDYRNIDAGKALYDTRSLAGAAAYAWTRARALAHHPDAPLPAGIGLAAALLALVIGALRRVSPASVAFLRASLRAVLLPEKTRFVRRHPVFAFVTPIVAAAFLSACGHVPGQGDTREEGATAQIQEDLTAGSNGPGYPVAGTYYFHQNHIGSSSVITNSAGQQVAHVEYKPYGEVVGVVNGVDQSDGQDIFRAKYTGKEWDSSAQLYYFNARYYDPLTGRFISADSHVVGGASQHAASVNPYAYANDSPIVYNDPSGHFFWIVIIVCVVLGAYAGGSAVNGWNPTTWNFSSWKTWTGIGVGGLVGGLAAGASIGVGGFAGAMLETTMNAAAVNSLRFLSPEGSSWKEFAIGMGTAIATGAITGKLTAGARNELGSTFRERLATKIAQRATVGLVGKLAASAVARGGSVAGLGALQEYNVPSAAVQRTKELLLPPEVSSRSSPPPHPEYVGASPFNQYLSSMSDSLLQATGADFLSGRTMKDIRKRMALQNMAPAPATP